MHTFHVSHTTTHIHSLQVEIENFTSITFGFGRDPNSRGPRPQFLIPYRPRWIGCDVIVISNSTDVRAHFIVFTNLITTDVHGTVTIVVIYHSFVTTTFCHTFLSILPQRK